VSNTGFQGASVLMGDLYTPNYKGIEYRVNSGNLSVQFPMIQYRTWLDVRKRSFVFFFFFFFFLMGGGGGFWRCILFL